MTREQISWAIYSFAIDNQEDMPNQTNALNKLIDAVCEALGIE